ncbi:hypothetical protein [Halodurantibacterium flavum]|uniref:Uncharacterized protein n=1 Tax=Halodurantibacterium flavum TaxID=1382802 RepID=A0ABW4S8Q7_9RHOB
MTPAVVEAMAAPEVFPFLLFEGQFLSGWVRLWSGIGLLQWGGRQWQGAGTLIGLGSVSETTDVVAEGTSVTLSGVPLDLVQIGIAEVRQGLPGRIWLGFLDGAGQIVPDPVLVFSGRCDVPEIADDAETCRITVSYESRLVDLQTPREWRYTHEAQQVLAPGDLGLAHVAAIQEREIKWGRG